MRPPTDAEMRAIAQRLEGTCNPVWRALDALDLKEELEVDEVEDRLLDYDLEQCRGCGWWFEPGELAGLEDDDEPGLCDDCRKEAADA